MKDRTDKHKSPADSTMDTVLSAPSYSVPFAIRIAPENIIGTSIVRQVMAIDIYPRFLSFMAYMYSATKASVLICKILSFIAHIF